MSKKRDQLNCEIRNELYSIQSMIERRHDLNFNFGVFNLGLGSRSKSYRKTRFSACRFYVHRAINRYRYLIKQQSLL